MRKVKCSSSVGTNGEFTMERELWRKVRLGDGSGFKAVGGDVIGGGGDFRDASFGIAMSDSGMGFGGGFRGESADGEIASSVFCPVESAVGKGEDFFVVHVDGGSHVPGKSGPADRDGAVERKARTFDLVRLAGNGREDASGERGGFLAFAKTGDDKELLAAPADQDVGIANGGADTSGEVDEHLIAGVVAEAVVDFLEMVSVDQIEDDVAIAAAARGIGCGVSANGLADVALDGGLEKSAVARGGERIGERHFLKFFVGLGKGFTTFGDSLFEPEALALEFARAVIHKGVEREEAEKYGEATRIPTLPPGWNHGKGKTRREAESAAGGAARYGESVITRGKSGIASFAARGFIEVGFQAGEAIGAANILWVAIGERGKIHAEIILATRRLGMAFAKAFARAELRGSNDDARRKLDSFVSGDRIVTSEATARTEEQSAILFGEKAFLAQVVPDQAIGAGEAKSTSSTEEFRETKSATGPDVALVIDAKHVDVERGQPLGQTIVSDLGFAVHQTQAAETKSVEVAEPNFIAADGSGFDDVVLQQTVGRREVQPVLAIEAREPVSANCPEDAVGAGCETTEALVNFGRQRNVDEMKRPLRRLGCF